jgi:hypothetical protein
MKDDRARASRIADVAERLQLMGGGRRANRREDSRTDRRVRGRDAPVDDSDEGKCGPSSD